MFLVAWLLVLVPAAIGLWCFAAFVLRGGRLLRLICTTLTPAIGVAVLFVVQYWTTRIPPAELGWDLFYFVVSLIGGAATLILTMPVFMIAEAFARRRS